MQDSLAETQAPRSLPPHENESKLGHSKNHRAAVEPHVFGEMVLGTQSFTSDFQGVQNAWMCPSAGPPGGQNVTGSLLQRAALRLVPQDFRKLVLIC